MPELLLDEAMGCTVGVIPIQDGLLFFKNRDLAYRYHANRMTVWQSTPESHMLKGANLETGELQGAAIGVNRHGVCVANTHIVSTPDVTYDLLCEQLVRETQSRDDVPRVVHDFMEDHATQGGRILVASSLWAFLVEVFADQFAIEDVVGSFVITNSFSLLPHQGEPSESAQQSSTNRLQEAKRLLPTISNVETLKSVLRSHVPEKGELSICNHRPDGGGTESSHIIQMRGKSVAWSYLFGFPCENDYHTVQLFQGE
jgi:hypothetical protein